MYMKKQDSPIKGMSDYQYVFCDFDGADFPVVIKEIDKHLHTNSKGVYEYVVPHCKHCNSRNVKKNGRTSRILYDDEGKRHEILVQRYFCSECGKHSQTEFEGQYEPYAHYSNSIKYKIIDAESLGRISLRQMSDIINIFLNHPMSHETVRKALLQYDDTYFSFASIVPISGYFGFDTQWIGINSKWKYRHVLFDLVHQVPIAELFSDNESNKTINNFIEKTIPTHQRNGIVTDLKPSYNKIMHQIGFKHQHCQFHFKQIISRHKTEYLQKEEKKLIKKYKKQGKYLKKVKKEMQKIKNKIKEELNEFYEFFNQKSIFQARNYINSIIPKIKKYTPFLRDYITKHFIPNYKKTINYMDQPRLDSTNNQTENFIGNTLSKHNKKEFKTMLGSANQVLIRDCHWIKKKLKINMKIIEIIELIKKQQTN